MSVLLAIVAVVGPLPWSAPLVALAAVTPALVAVDVVEHRLPNRIVLPGYLACLAALSGDWALRGELPLMAVLTGAATAGFLALLGITGGMGAGDVKLGGVLGTVAGGLGFGTAAMSPLLGFLLGGAAAMVAARRGGRASRIPFGPYLLGGFWVAVLLGAVPR